MKKIKILSIINVLLASMIVAGQCPDYTHTDPNPAFTRDHVLSLIHF